MANEFLDKFLDHVKTKSSEIALGDGNIVYSWKEYGILSGKVYAYLKDRGIGKEQVVGIRLGRGLAQLICEIGILRNGSAFVALDTDSVPEDRSRYIEKNSECVLILGEKEWNEILDYRSEEGYNPEPDDRNLAFAVYTSGSTGRPKGALHERGSLTQSGHSVYNGSTSMIEGFDRFGVLIPQSMAAALIFTIKSTFMGASVFIPPLSVVKDPSQLHHFLEEFHITNVFAPPVLVPLIESAKSLRLILVGGELCIHTFSEKVPLYQIYAASESMFVLNTTRIYKEDPLPTLEVPAPENKVQIVDGELCFYNPYFRGYAGDPDATRSVFLQNDTVRLEDKIYRSRDGAKWDEKGRLVVTGRLDDMFKINGNRVEPGEVESAFKSICEAKEAAMLKFDVGNRSVTVMFYTQPQHANQTVNLWKEQLSKNLPHYMIPTYFVQISEFPHLRNGKLNRRGLFCPDFSKLHPEYIAPETEIQKEIASAFEESLEISHVGLDDDFFLLGGDSIAAMELLLNLEKYALQLQDIDSGKTVGGIAEILTERGIVSNVPKSVAQKKSYPLLLTQKHMLLQQLENSGFSPLWLNVQLEIPKGTSLEKFKSAVDSTLQAHPAFLFVFEQEKDQYRQRFAPELFKPTEIQIVEDLHKERSRFFKPGKILGEPLYRARIFKDSQKAVFVLTVNHAMIDGSSLSMFICDLQRTLNGKIPVKDSYFEALEEFERFFTPENKSALSEFEKKSEAILQEYATLPSPDFQGMWGACAKTSERDVPATPYLPTEIYAYAYAKTLHEYNQTDKVAFVITHHGKVTEAQLQCCGNFASDILISLNFDGTSDLELFKNLRAQIQKALKSPYRPVLPPMSAVIYQSNVLEMKLFGINVAESYIQSDFDIAENALNVHIFKKNGRMKLICEFDSARFKRESMEKFSELLQKNIEDMDSRKEFLFNLRGTL